MIKCEDLAQIFQENNLTYFSGVPDSTFKDWMKFLADSPPGFTNRIAVNECEAVANCAGYNLATGKTGVVYMQNSGLGKTVNPLTSLVSKEVYSIPIVLMIGWRGNPEDPKGDEPQHKMMGRVMLSQLETLEVPYKVLPEEIEQVAETIRWARESAEQQGYASAIIIKKGTLEEYEAKTRIKTSYEMSREDAIKTLIGIMPQNAAIVSTTGKTSRELFEKRIADGVEPRDFLTVGSMGCSLSMASETALQKSDKKIYCFDGDGAVLMQMGALATVGSNKPKNLTHIVFDNASYDSTGGQPTVSPTVDFAKVALACGYSIARTVQTKQELIETERQLQTQEGPKMLIVKVNKGARKDLGRPTKTPIENKKAFMDFLKE